MAQMKPNYPHMTSSVNDVFINPLIEKYGNENVIWPIVFIKDDAIHSYLYEVNADNSLNTQEDNRPISNSDKTSFFADYTSDPRILTPESKELSAVIDEDNTCCYDFSLKSDEFNTVDLDYVWQTSDGWKAIELTTLWMPLSSKKEAERLVKMFKRRPSWKGAKGPHGIRRLIQASSDLNLDYWMICVNSKKGVSNDLVTDGNVFGFPLTDSNIDRILKGEAPENSRFGSFAKFLDWL